MGESRIPFLDLKRINESFEPALTAAVRRVMDSGFYIRGEEVRKFEEAYAIYTGTSQCVGVGNGFDALRLIFRAWIVNGVLREGDEVLVPANTYIASILPVTDNRLRPVFVEPDPATMNIDPERVEASITSRTRVLLLVHLYGRNAMTDSLKSTADRHGLKIVEDNAQAAGCMSVGKRTGSLGDAAAHSFFPTKNLGAIGDGGAVTTDDPALSEMVRTLGNYGSSQRGHHAVQGVNSRLDELQAAVLNVKLPRLDRDNERRRAIASRYKSEIVNPLIRLPGGPTDEKEHVWHLFVIRTKLREALQKYLSGHGIETLIHYPVPPHRQPAFSELNAMRHPISEDIHDEVLSLPLHPLLPEADVDRIIRVVSEFRES